MFDTNNLKIGLALGSGGPRGLAHVGVIRALSEAHIPISFIAGASAGSIMGGLFAMHGSHEKLEEFARNITLKDLSMMLGGVGGGSGLIRSSTVKKYFRKLTKARKIENLKIPFCAVATDALTGKTLRIKKGDLATAMAASSAIPSIFEMVKANKRCLVDGGVSEPVPVDAVRQMGADLVIAVNLDSYKFVKKDKLATDPKYPKPTEMGIIAIKMLRYHLAKENCKNADITIRPKVSSIASLSLPSFVNGGNTIELGYKETKKQIRKIKALIEAKTRHLDGEINV